MRYVTHFHPIPLLIQLGGWICFGPSKVEAELGNNIPCKCYHVYRLLTKSLLSSLFLSINVTTQLLLALITYDRSLFGNSNLATLSKQLSLNVLEKYIAKLGSKMKINNKLGLSCAKLSSSWLQAYSASDQPNQLSWSWIELG